MMNSRIEKEFENFVFEGEELLIVEKALFSLLDRYKDQLIRSRLSMEEGTDKIIYRCLEIVKLHSNFRKNKKFFTINIQQYDEFKSELSNADKEKLEGNVKDKTNQKKTNKKQNNKVA